MSKYTPNTLIQNRYLLVELISYDGQSGRQVWAVKDNQTGKRMIGRFQQNGTVEWFDDNRPQVSSSKLQPPNKPSVPLLRQPKPGGSTMKPYYPILIILLAAVLVIGYYKRDQLASHFKAGEEASERLETTKGAEFADSAAVYVDALSGLESQDDKAVRPVETPSVDTLMAERGEPQSRSPLSARERSARKSEIRLLVGTIGSQTKQMDKAAFDRLTDLIQELMLDEDGREFIDSLYIVMAGRGASSIQAFDENGDKYLKALSIEWYRLAYILKPSSLLKDRIDRLAAKPAKGERGRKARPDKNANELFLKDPELK